MDINNESNNTTSDVPQAPAPGSGFKKVATVIIAIAVLAAIFYGVSKLNKNKPKPQFNLQNINSLQIDDKKQALEDQLEKYKADASALAADAGASTKATVYARLADVQIRLELYQDAIATLDKIPDERKNNGTVAALYAQAFNGLGDKAKATEYIKKALVSSDDVPEYWQLYLGLSQDMDSAALNALYFEALTKTDNNIDIMTDFAASLERRGDKPGAISIWQKAIAKDPAHQAKYQAEIDRLKA